MLPSKAEVDFIDFIANLGWKFEKADAWLGFFDLPLLIINIPPLGLPPMVLFQSCFPKFSPLLCGIPVVSHSLGETRK